MALAREDSENVRAQSKQTASGDDLLGRSGDRRGRARRRRPLCGYKLAVTGHTSGAALT